jgi:hypothetical protein
MSLFIIAVAAGAALALVAGGSVRNLARLPIFGLPLVLVWLALGLQFGLLVLADGVVTPALLLSYALIASAVALVFVRVVREGDLGGTAWGLVIVGAGWLLNALVIAANGGMPYARETLVNAGMSPDPADHGVLIPKRIPRTDDTHLAALGDVIQLPGTGQLVSSGDLVLAVGFAVLVFAAMTASRRVERLADAG